MNNTLHNEYIELQVLDALAKNKTQTTISQELSLSIGKVNYIAKALVGKGFIKVGNFIHADEKKRYKYLLTDDGIIEKITITKKFINRKKLEYEKLQEELEYDMQKWGGKLNEN